MSDCCRDLSNLRCPTVNKYWALCSVCHTLYAPSIIDGSPAAWERVTNTDVIESYAGWIEADGDRAYLEAWPEHGHSPANGSASDSGRVLRGASRGDARQQTLGGVMDGTIAVTKEVAAVTCGHWSWRDDGPCRNPHGYERRIFVEITGPVSTRDERGWLFGFGAFRGLRALCEDTWDHALLIAEDDPALDDMTRVASKFGWRLVICDPTIEGMALTVHQLASRFLELREGVTVTAVTVAESDRNRITYRPQAAGGG